MKGTTPTSHILKPLMVDIQESVQNEFFCLRLAKLMNLNAAPVNIYWVGDTPCLLVTRYDRQQDENGRTVRLHQEDVCQAMGIFPERKYEREGGPSIADCITLLQRNSKQPAVDTLAYLRVVIFNYLIGNADAHGKNYSLLYQDGQISLAPSYDLLSTAVYPEVSHKMAMKIGGKYNPDELFLRHWQRLVPDTAAARKALGKDLQNMSLTIVTTAIGLSDKLRNEGLNASIISNILDVIKERAARLQKQL